MSYADDARERGRTRAVRGSERLSALARSLGWLFLAGSVIGGVALLLPLPPGTDRVGTLLVVVVCLVLGLGLLAGAPTLPPVAVHAMLALGTLAISVDIAFSGGRTVGDEMFYLWPAFCAFYFCARSRAVAHFAIIAVGYAAGLTLGHVPEAPTRWTVVLCTLAVMWLVIDRLVARLDGEARETIRRGAELSAAEERFRRAFDDASTGMTLGRFDGTWLRVNRAFARFVGREGEDLTGSTFGRVSHPEDIAEGVRALERLASGELEDWQAEWRFIRRDGTLVWGLVSVAVVRDREDRPLHYIAQVQDITDRKRAEAELAHQALHDPLTGLPNRVLFFDRLGQALARLTRRRTAVAVLFLDIDRFKLVNDSFGHGLGDTVIARLAARLRELLRPEDTLARLGGDEFTILCESDDPGAPVAIAERVVAALGEPFDVAGQAVFLSASIGIAHTRDPAAEPDRLLAEADAAMYRAKQGGRSRYAVFAPAMRLHGAQRLEVESGLRRALERDELELRYQPVVELASGRIVGVEALVRWRHPERGLLEPAEFIDVAEDNRLIVPLGAWVLEEACRQGRRWHDAGRRLQVAVNLSPRQLADRELTATVARALDSTGLPADALCLEITENAVIDDLPSGLRLLRQIKDLGVTLALDDFGVGFSSLAQVRRLAPVDVLKIDRCFTSGVGKHDEDSAIVAAMLAIGSALGLGTVAEGIERPQQARELHRLGCRLGQGFLFARPAPAAALDVLLEGAELGRVGA
jgi:diguanylate cyclase (GGDEF)-like protein/PAS domain S-box-containing protein